MLQQPIAPIKKILDRMAIFWQVFLRVFLSLEERISIGLEVPEILVTNTVQFTSYATHNKDLNIELPECLWTSKWVDSQLYQAMTRYMFLDWLHVSGDILKECHMEWISYQA